MLLESSIMLLEDIYSRCITYDVHHLQSLYFILHATDEPNLAVDDSLIYSPNSQEA